MQANGLLFTTCLGAALALTLAGCGGDHASAPASAPANVALSDGARFAPAMAGAWRVLGQGAYLRIDAGSIRRYHETPSYCYPESTSIAAADLADVTMSPEVNGRVDLFAAPDTPYEWRLQRVSALPSRCLAPAPAAPIDTARALCEMVELHYPFLRERGIDWPARCARLMAEAQQARGEDDLRQALIHALDGFNDLHVNLVHTGRQEELFEAGGSATMDMLKQAFSAQDEATDFYEFHDAWSARVRAAAGARLTDRHDAFGGAVVWGRLPGNIGYLSIGRMAQLSENGGMAADLRAAGEEIDRALAALADTRAMVVDVAVNLGGYDAVSAVFASRFADRRRLAFTSRAKGDDSEPVRAWHVEPRGARQYTRPVYLLTSGQTISAGETFVLMMRALPHVRQAGQHTAGALSDMLPKPLPGPFGVNLSFQVNRDAGGVLFEGGGIAPHLAIPVFEPGNPQSLLDGHARALDALLAQIPQEPAR